MKKFFPLLLGLISVAGANAEGVDLQNRILVNRAKMTKDGVIKAPASTQQNMGFKKTRGSEEAVNSGSELVINAFVKIADGYSKADLESAGMTVNAVKGGIAVVSFPAERLEEYSTLECVKKIQVERSIKAQMDMARAASGVDEIHKGSVNNMPYTGKGVVAGIVDQGVDPNHIAFLDENGKNRVKFLAYYDGQSYQNGYPLAKYYGDNIVYEDEKGNVKTYPTVDQFNTDTYAAYHGTHTLNILGGGYHGDVTYYKDGLEFTGPNPYYGAAPDAELTVSCGDLSDASVAWGLYDLLDYAAYKKQEDNSPAVISLSLGSTAGPHDPHNLMNAFLTECGDEAIVVVSAGNEGDLKLALNKTFTKDDTELKSMVYPYGFQYDPSQPAGQYNTFIRNGVVMVYSNDETPFTIQGFIMTGEPGNYRKRATLDISGADGMYYCSDSYYINYVGGVVNQSVARYFDGYIGGGCMLDEELGRYYGAFDYYLYTNPATGINSDGSEGVIVGFEITGSDGQRIDCYCDGENTWIYNYGMEGYQDGSRDGTISDMAVGDNILVVGAYNTRYDWTALDGKSYNYGEYEGFAPGLVGPYSSYGTLADGRTLPHVCAPGTAVMSAFSNPYIENYFKGYESYIPSNTTAKATVGGKNYYWKPETGTSMSTPFVAGSIALWLEADPTLTINDVYDIIEKTSKKDDNVLSGNAAQWGAGKFDALAGIKEVINNAGVEQITIDDRNDRLILSEISPNVFNIFVGSAKNLDVNVYSISGNLVSSKKISGNETTVDLSSFSKGIYLVKANNHASKILVK